ncbi:MAG: hypothetical protein ABIG60_03965 [Patescibacteria group bacterium]
MCSPAERIIQKIKEESRVEIEAYYRRTEKWGAFWAAVFGMICALIFIYLPVYVAYIV